MEEGIRLGQADPLDRWAIGDLCVEAVPPGEGRAARSAMQRRLAEFAAETGLSLGLVKDCHRTSEAWPAGRRFADITHAKHSKYAARANRVDLLLNDDMDDEGLPLRVREKVERIEGLLADAAVRQAVIDRSRKRGRRITAAARAIEDEELLKARVNQRLAEQHAKALAVAPEILSKMAERAIKGNAVLARMIADLLELKTVIRQLPANYHERTAEHLEQIQKAAVLALDELRPETRSPQPCDVIDMTLETNLGQSTDIGPAGASGPGAAPAGSLGPGTS